MEKRSYNRTKYILIFVCLYIVWKWISGPLANYQYEDLNDSNLVNTELDNFTDLLKRIDSGNFKYEELQRNWAEDSISRAESYLDFNKTIDSIRSRLDNSKIIPFNESIPLKHRAIEVDSIRKEKICIDIELSEIGLFINSFRITKNTKFDEIKSIIGTPSRHNTFITSDNRIYTYDDYGILIYQKVGKQEIISITIEFKMEEFEFASTNPFCGVLKLNRIKISKSTSLLDLKFIQGLTVHDSRYFSHAGELYHHGINIRFNDHNDKNGIISFSIEVNNSAVKKE